MFILVASNFRFPTDSSNSLIRICFAVSTFVFFLSYHTGKWLDILLSPVPVVAGVALRASG